MFGALQRDARISGFSALQRAENSSMVISVYHPFCYHSFSALQRAENSSIADLDNRADVGFLFQCSSASRKFLNDTM